MKEQKAKNKNQNWSTILFCSILTLALVLFAAAVIAGLVIEVKPGYPAANQAVGPIAAYTGRAPVICIYVYPALNQAVGWIIGFPSRNQAAGPIPPALAANQAVGPIGK